MHKPTKVIGVLNLTPDSFSDGGLYNKPLEAARHVESMLAHGVSVIDVGAESTRTTQKNTESKHEDIPQRKPTESIGPDVEWERLKHILPEVLEVVKGEKIGLSIDTRHFSTIQKAVGIGFDYINKVSGYDDVETLKLIANNKHLKVVLMHSLGIPADPHNIVDQDLDVVNVVKKWFNNKIHLFDEYGISRKRVIIDPGIGYGKRGEQSLQLLKRISEFKPLLCEILVGHSRKSFLNLFTNRPYPERDIETYAVSIYLALQQIDYLRVHDVEGNMRSLKVASHLLEV
jgi:dihydropteroate synthase